jgi:hypothetical protein
MFISGDQWKPRKDSNRELSGFFFSFSLSWKERENEKAWSRGCA